LFGWCRRLAEGQERVHTVQNHENGSEARCRWGKLHEKSDGKILKIVDEHGMQKGWIVVYKNLAWEEEVEFGKNDTDDMNDDKAE